MSNPSSPASSSSSSAAAAAQKEHRRLQEEQTQTLHHHHHHQAEVAAAAAGIIPFPPSSSEDQAHDDRDKDDAELSPPRCEWEFRLSATVPTTALPGASDAIGSVDFDPTGRLLATGGIARKIRLYDHLDGHARAVTYVRWAGTNGPGMAARRVVTSAADGTHRLWEWSTAAAAEEEVLDAREVFDAREVRSYSGHASARSFVGMGVWRGAGLVASGSESNHVFVYDLRWAKPIWVHPFAFGGGAHGGPVTATCPGPGAAAQVDADGGGFVSAVAWRQASHNDDDGLDGGALVAGGSDGVLKVFTCRRRGDDDDDDHGLRSSSEL